jgi:hypothetical protein
MAVATLIASAAQSGIQPRTVHAGVNAVHSVYSATSTLSASQTVNICRIPDGARITGVKANATTNLKQLVFSVGVPGDTEVFITSASCGTTKVFYADGGIGNKYDTSDDAALASTLVVGTITTSASGTSGGSVSWIVEYFMDGAT